MDEGFDDCAEALGGIKRDGYGVEYVWDMMWKLVFL